MFSAEVWMVFKSARLTTVREDGVEQRMAECQFVIEPFGCELARDLGASVASHLFTEGGVIRSELKTVSLALHVPLQRLFARADEALPATVITDVEILGLTGARVVDDRSGDEWIKATVRAQFSFGPAAHRDWIAQTFGYGFWARFESMQGDLLEEQPAAAHAEAPA